MRWGFFTEGLKIALEGIRNGQEIFGDRRRETESQVGFVPFSFFRNMVKKGRACVLFAMPAAATAVEICRAGDVWCFCRTSSFSVVYLFSSVL